MEGYFRLNGKKLSYPVRSEMIGQQEPASIRHNQNAFPVANPTQKLSEPVHTYSNHSTGTPEQSSGSLRNTSSYAKTYELLFPILIALFLGSIAVAMGRHTSTGSATTATASPKSRTVATSHASYQPETIRTIDTVALLHTAPLVKKRPATASKARPYVDGSSDRAAYYRDNWSKYLTLSHSRYKHGLLGGIRGLAVTFTNNTDYTVDEVVAEITYVKTNSKTWKTRRIPLRNIGPHSSRSQNVTNVNRSRSVQVSIRKLASSSLKLYYTRP